MHIVNVLPESKSKYFHTYNFGSYRFFEALDANLENSNLTETQVDHIHITLKEIFSDMNIYFKTKISPRISPPNPDYQYPSDAVFYPINTYQNRWYNATHLINFYSEVLQQKLYNLDAYLTQSNIDLNFSYSIHELLNLDRFFNGEEENSCMVLTTPITKQARYKIITGHIPQSTFVNEFITNFLDLHYIFTTSFDLQTETNNKKVFSALHPNFVNNFKINELPVVDSLNYTPETYRESFYFKNSSNFFSRTEFPTFSKHKSKPPIFLSKNTPSLFSTDKWNTSTANTFTKISPSNIDDLFDENLNQYQIYHLPSWESRSSSQPAFKVVNRNFLKRRKGAFVPVLIKNQACLNPTSSEEIYTLVIFNFSNKDYSFQRNFCHYSLMSKAFMNFVTLYNFKDALYFKDQEEYLKLLNKQYEDNFIFTVLKNKHLDLNKVKNHINNHNKFISSIDVASNSKEYTFNNSKLLTEQTLIGLSSTYKKNPLLERKKAKLTLKFQKIKQNIKQLGEKCAFVNEYVNKEIDILRQTYYKSIALNKIKNPSTPKTVNLNNYFKLINFSKDLNQKIIQDRQLKIDNNDLITDPFFLNLKENDIHLIFISYKNKNGEMITINHENLLNENIDNQISEYKQVNFLIDKPVQIFVDSKTKPKAVKIGGPYIVNVTEDSLHIKLKDKNSFTGFVNGSTLYHPHVSTTNNVSNDWQRACLGDATPLLYNAFKENNLKLIILSAMTWVCSANSTDAWGKRYKSFLDYELFDLDNLPSKETLTPNETENIISSLSDSLIEEQSQEEQLTETPIPQHPQTISEEEFTATPTTYTSYFNWTN